MEMELSRIASACGVKSGVRHSRTTLGSVRSTRSSRLPSQKKMGGEHVYNKSNHLWPVL